MKIAKERLIVANVNRKGPIRYIFPIILYSIAVTIAIKKFDTGPASAVRALSRLLCSKFHSLIGIGLLQPNRNITIIMAPIGSICANGLRVNLPCALAVGSPNLYALHAWKYS